MFCSKCGAKLSPEDKFCKKCGQAVSPPSNEKLSEDISKSNATGSSLQPAAQEKPKKSKAGICVVSCIAIAAILGILITIAAIFFPYLFGSYNSDTFDNVQNILADVLVAKSLGDDMAAGKIPQDFTYVKTISQAAVDNLAEIKDTRGFTDYYNDISTFCNGINNSATDTATWANRPEEPSSFTSLLSGRTADKMFSASLNKIATVKDYGDWAIATGDTETMRSIYAQLEAQYIFMSDLKIDQESSTSNNDIIFSAYAENEVKVTTGICKKSGCAPDVKRVLPGVVRSARNYSVGEPAVSSDWTNSWNELNNVIEIKNGYNLEMMGVIQNGTPTVTVSPMEQDFIAECSAKGGTTGGSGEARDRLPTSLDAGTFDCSYKDKNLSCWYILTLTGIRFMGGEGGCPELGLMPKLIENLIDTSSSWDGNYNVTMKKPNCDSPVELTAFQVSDNEVLNLYGENAPIDAGGNATLYFSYGPMIVNISFSGNGASGTWQSDECSGTFTATKSWF